MCTENEEKKPVFDENTRTYLQMIQEPICRMSTISGIFKGFTATIVAGISLITYDTVNWGILGLSFLPVIVFAILDVSYLRQERKFRELYEKVCSGEHPVDFSLDTREMKGKRTTIRSCLKSWSIYLFYPIMAAIVLLVFVLKTFNVI